MMTALQPIVLIVDDDPAGAGALRQILERRGVRTIMSDANDALETLSTFHPDAIVAEQWLTDIRGSDLLIAARGKNADILRVLTTGGSLEHFSVHESATIQAVIPRPWDEVIINAFVRLLCSRRRGQPR